jgi:hypothetical protein
MENELQIASNCDEEARNTCRILVGKIQGWRLKLKPFVI